MQQNNSTVLPSINVMMKQIQDLQDRLDKKKTGTRQKYQQSKPWQYYRTRSWCKHDRKECMGPAESHINNTTADSPQGGNTRNLHLHK